MSGSTRGGPEHWSPVVLASAVGCGCVLSALLWQPPFARPLIACGVIALTVAAVSYLRQLLGRP
jgi:hypothetical protein